MYRLVTLSLGLATALIATPLVAQTKPSMLVQATLGVGTSEGGRYAEREEFTSEFMLGWRVPARTVPFTIGMALGRSFDGGSADMCEIAIGGTCTPSSPRFGYMALLGGVEAHGKAGAIGVMAGPAFVAGKSSEQASRSWTSGARVGAQLRLDVASPSFYHVALTMSPRVVWVPNVGDATLSLRSLNFGLRFQ